MSSTSDPVRLGVAGLGRAFVLMLPSFRADPRVKLMAAAAPRAESREAFTSEFGGTGHASVEALCVDPAVEAILARRTGTALAYVGVPLSGVDKSARGDILENVARHFDCEIEI